MGGCGGAAVCLSNKRAAIVGVLGSNHMQEHPALCNPAPDCDSQITFPNLQYIRNCQLQICICWWLRVVLVSVQDSLLKYNLQKFHQQVTIVLWKGFWLL